MSTRQEDSVSESSWLGNIIPIVVIVSNQVLTVGWSREKSCEYPLVQKLDSPFVLGLPGSKCLLGYMKGFC